MCNENTIIGINNIWTTHPQIAELLVNPEDGYKYTKSSSVKVEWKCLDCKYINMNSIATICSYLKCKKCKDNMSLGEKIVYELLDYKDINFNNEVAFNWSNRKRYDFYLPEYNTIIEVHGEQHYIQTNRKGARTLQEEQDNDDLKEKLAKENGIEHYIVIDARRSDSEWIINNILNNELLNWVNIKRKDFENLNIKPNRLTLRVWDLWNCGLGVMSISEELKISKNAVKRCLNLGKSLGKCDYDTNDKYSRMKKSVLQLDIEGEILNKFESMISAKNGNPQKSLQLNIHPFDLIKKTDGYIWIYENEYLKYEKILKDKLLEYKNENRIFQLDKEFNLIATYENSIVASEKTGYDYSNIRKACRNNTVTFKGFIWLNYSDYLKFNQNKLTTEMLSKRNYKTRKVVKMSVNFQNPHMYNSVAEASKDNDVKNQSHISRCCRGERNTCGGYKWMYLEDYEIQYGKLS